jgi:hypothetical protein
MIDGFDWTPFRIRYMYLDVAIARAILRHLRHHGRQFPSLQITEYCTRRM